MKALRRLGFALWLAFALVAGQQAAAVHMLGHASESLSQKQGPKPQPSKCGECFACSQLAAGAAPTIPDLPPVECGIATTPFVAGGERLPPFLAYLSRGPPALL